jgi:hypothetical protein
MHPRQFITYDSEDLTGHMQRQRGAPGFCLTYQTYYFHPCLLTGLAGNTSISTTARATLKPSTDQRTIAD